MSPAENPLKSKSTIIAALIFFVTAALYLLTLANGFVYDDNFVVLDNPLIRGGAPIGDIFFKNVWSFFGEDNKANFFRPLQLLLYRAEYSLFGLTPWPWHLMNLLLHALNAVLVFLIAVIILPSASVGEGTQRPGGYLRGFPPIVAALVFAFHPVNVEPVAWVSSVSDLLFTFFLLLGFYFYISKKPLKGEGVGVFDPRFLLALVAFFLALLGKETAMVFIPLIFLYDLSSFKAQKGSGEGFKWTPYIPFILAASLYMLLRTYALGGLVQKETVDIGAFKALINIFPLFFAYIGKLVLPVNLSVIYSLEYAEKFSDPATLTGLLVSIAFIILFIYYRKRVAPSTALSLIALPLLPILYIPVISTGGFSERYLYLSTVGFGLFLGYVFVRGTCEITLRYRAAGTKRVRLLTRLAAVSIAILLALYLAGTVQRIGVWKDDLTLWLDALENSPKSAIAHYNLGTIYQGERSYPEALWHYQNAARLDTSYSAAFFNIGSIFADVRRYPDAAIYFEKAARLDPERSEFSLSLARAYLAGGNTEKAVKVLDTLLGINPGLKEAEVLLKEAGKYNVDQ
ncbi:MAG: tetratricopeptide repeat protein [Thermodesulfobacteriota bacterium]